MKLTQATALTASLLLGGTGAAASPVDEVLGDAGKFSSAVNDLSNNALRSREVSRIAADGRPNVWLIGDSITDYYDDYFIAQHPEWNVTALGQGGETSLTALDRILPLLDAAVGEDAPDVCIILYGTNDIALQVHWLQELGLWDGIGVPTQELPEGHPYRIEETVPRIVTIAEHCEAQGGKAVLGLPIGFPIVQLTPFAQWFSNQFEIIRIGLRRTGYLTVNFRLTQVRDFTDPFHPSLGAAENKLAPRVAAQVRRELRRMGVN